jgi:hypothetical protein
MVILTEQAVIALQALLHDAQATPGQGVKLAPDGKGRITFTVEAPGADDEVIVRDDVPVLILERQLAARLEGLLLDYHLVVVEGRPSAQFTLRQPESQDGARPAP